LFWGYKRYDQWRNPSLSLFDRINIGERAASVLNSILPGKYMQSKAALELEPDPLHRHFTLFLSPALENLVAQPPWEDDIWAMKEVALIRSREDLPAVLDVKTYLADAMLYKVDRASMAASLEVRVPYLDNTVVDYAFALPFHYKSNNVFKHKAVLKELLQQLAPHYAIDRPKKGFNFPLDKWMRFAWKERVIALVNRDNLTALGLDHNLYLPMVKQYYAGNKKLCIVVWYLLNLALWHQKFKKISALTRI